MSGISTDAVENTLRRLKIVYEYNREKDAYIAVY